MYNQGSKNDVVFLSSTKCIFQGNFARGGGDVFRIVETHIFSSTNNVYVRNIGITTSVLSARDANVLLADDVFASNIGTIFVASDLKSVYISNTEFTNNTGSIVSISNSVNSFTCSRCILQQNMAEEQGLSIAYADQVISEVSVL